jgi:hypothetical protein
MSSRNQSMLRALAAKATRQEAPGAAIAAQDEATYVRLHAGFFDTGAVPVFCNAHGAAAPTVDGDFAKGNGLPLTLSGAIPPSTMWTAASAIIDRRSYAQAKRRTLNQNLSKPMKT